MRASYRYKRKSEMLYEDLTGDDVVAVPHISGAQHGDDDAKHIGASDGPEGDDLEDGDEDGGAPKTAAPPTLTPAAK